MLLVDVMMSSLAKSIHFQPVALKLVFIAQPGPRKSMLLPVFDAGKASRFITVMVGLLQNL